MPLQITQSESSSEGLKLPNQLKLESKTFNWHWPKQRKYALHICIDVFKAKWFFYFKLNVVMFLWVGFRVISPCPKGKHSERKEGSWGIFLLEGAFVLSHGIMVSTDWLFSGDRKGTVQRFTELWPWVSVHLSTGRNSPTHTQLEYGVDETQMPQWASQLQST